MRRRLGGTSLSSEARSRKSPAKRNGWADEAIKSFLPPTENILPVQGQKKPGGPEIDEDTEIGCRLQGYEIRLLLLYHDPEGEAKREQILNALYGHGLRGGEDQPASRYPRSKSQGTEPTQRPMQHR